MRDPDLPMPIIVAARIEHVADITRLHKGFIADQESQEALASGTEFLHAYYSDLITRNDCALHVAVAGTQVVGYVSLVANQTKILLSLLCHRPWLLVHTALSPKFWRHFIHYVLAKLSLEFLGHKWADLGTVDDLDVYRHAVELRSIAVEPAWRGHAIGAALIKEAQKQAIAYGWPPIISWVAETNLASNLLFQRAGFRLITQRGEPSKAVNLYSWNVPMPPAPSLVTAIEDHNP